MASVDQCERAINLYTELRGSGKYPPWKEVDIAEMLAQGVDDQHIKTEWAHVVKVYHDLRGDVGSILWRITSGGRFVNPNVSVQTVEEWIANGLSEDMINLEYIRSVPEPDMYTAEAFLNDLEWETRSSMPEPFTPEDILFYMKTGWTGEQIATEYVALQQTKYLSDQAVHLRQGVNEELEDSWIELHYGLLYATTHLPSEPVVLRNMHRSQDQYNTYFASAPAVDPLLFNAKTARLMTATVVKLDKRLNQRIKQGGHPKALNTMFTSDDLTAYRKIRANTESGTDDLDVENDSQIWQFLMDLAARLHPHLAEPQEQASLTVQPTNTAKKSRFDLKKWADAERHALWRCINAWCKEHGIDKFEAKNLDTDTLQNFADSINAVRAGQDEDGLDRTAETVQGQVRDAIRGDVSLANRPIFNLGERAKKTAEDIRNNRVIPDSVRYPDEAIDMSGIP
jgi:uncharacterized protein (DUF433 family)